MGVEKRCLKGHAKVKWVMETRGARLNSSAEKTNVCESPEQNRQLSYQALSESSVKGYGKSGVVRILGTWTQHWNLYHGRKRNSWQRKESSEAKDVDVMKAVVMYTQPGPFQTSLNCYGCICQVILKSNLSRAESLSLSDIIWITSSYLICNDKG